MTVRSQIPEPTHSAGDVLHGFRIEAVTPLDEIKALVYEATHQATGAKLVHVHCNDEENLFSVGFPTPPPDSTGVAHILEHSVLAGSEKYPVKDAFNELGKRTLNTFLNAMTWPDRTVYPTASAVRADYFNLASVYMDLVFHPLLEEKTFKQEGHHLELEDPADPDSPLKVSGVVYNEMKGANASPERMHYRAILAELMEDTPYAHDSGGDPAVMPELDFESFVGFHRQFYSPSNAHFFLYGDVGFGDNLEFLETRLHRFERVDVDSEIPLQKPWSEPRSKEIEYSIGTDDDADDKTFVTVSWLANETTDVHTSILMDIAIDALSGSAGSPMRKALTDSQLGQAVYPSGSYSGGERQTHVTFGLRGTNPDKADAIVELIMETLTSVIETGLDPELVEASFQQIELGGKEISPPFPIMLLVRTNPVWYFGGDPKDGLRFGHHIEAARAAWEREPGVFERLLKEWLVDNPHRLTLTMKPQPGLAAARESADAEKMVAFKETLSPDELARINSEAQELLQAQMSPESPETIALLPSLELDQIPKAPRVVETTIREDSHGVTVLENEAFSNGLGYVGFAFDTTDVTDEEAVLLPFLGRAIRGLGAAGHSYEAMATRIVRHLGSVRLGPSNGRRFGDGERFEHMLVASSALHRNAEMIFTIVRELLCESDTTDHKRLKDMIRESASRSMSSVVPSGHAYARTRAAASLGPVRYRSEQWGGLTQLRWLRDTAENIDDRVESLAAQIAGLQKRIFTRDRLMVSLAGDPAVLDSLRPMADAFVASLPLGESVKAAPSAPPATLARDVGVPIPATVNYVGVALDGPDMTHTDAPAFELLANILRSEYLYQKIRVQGGAYGGFATYAKDTGTFAFLSYRDPQLTETLDVYNGVVNWLKSSAFDDATVDASRIGTIGNFDHVLTAEQRLGVARRRYQLGLGEDQRQAFRDGLFSCTADDIRKAALPLFESQLGSAPRVALGSSEALDAANEKLDSPLTIEPLESK